jgi:hypothetical protein
MIKQSVDNIIPKRTTLNGIYRGVIEDNNDPEKLGRCKIRIWGVHDELKNESEIEGIPTNKLPWSEPCLGLVEGSVSGAGAWAIPLQGSHVFLFFEGGNWESPRYFATVPALPVDAPDTSKGFNDPAGEYPRSDRLGEPDWHRLARGETEGTIVPFKDANKDEEVKIALTGPTYETWDEPDSAYAAEYPNNIVLATHRGITIELDNTVGAERVHIWHPSNTYIEIDVDGNVVFKSENDRFEITKGDRKTHVMKDDIETVDVDRNTLIGGDQNVEVGGNVNRDIGTKLTENVGSDWKIDVVGNISITAGGTISITAGEGINITAGEAVVVKGQTIDLN